jgi:polyisoprenoid-binding protein YceI
METTVSTATLPQTGTWVIDPSHSAIEFVVRHLMVAKVRGRFASFSGTVTVGDPVTDSVVEVSIDAASFTTDDEQRDGHVRSAEFLDVETFPTLTFRGTAPRQQGDGWVLPGELTIRDVTETIELEVEPLGLVVDPWGNTKAGFSASGEIDRERFGITWNQALEAGGVLVGNKVRLEIEVQLAAQA